MKCDFCESEGQTLVIYRLVIGNIDSAMFDELRFCKACYIDLFTKEMKK